MQSHPSQAIVSSPVPASIWQGQLQLEFTHRLEGTQLSRSFVQAPLKVQRPFYPEGPEVCHVVTLHTAGGIVGGDRLSSSIHLHPNTNALITTATAGKIYRSNGFQAIQTTQIHIAEESYLEWLPQETIVFDGADYRQTLRVELGEQALWCGWDITRLGRTARGEQFLRGHWRSHTEVWQQGHPIWIDPQWVQGGSTMMSSPHGLAGCSVVGSLAIVGRSISKPLVEQVRQLWQPSEESSSTGVTRLMAGILCRYRGNSTLEARRWFTKVWHVLRSELVNRPSCQPRVW